MFVVAKRDILEMVETAQVKCHDAVVFDLSVLDDDTFNILFTLFVNCILLTQLEIDKPTSP